VIRGITPADPWHQNSWSKRGPLGDILLSVDGQAITGADDLVRLLTGDTIGRSVGFDLLRAGERLQLAVTPTERPRR